MKFFAHKTSGGWKTAYYRIEVKNNQIWFGKIGLSFLYEPVLSYSIPGIFAALYYYLYAKSAYKRRISKLNSLQKTEEFLEKRGNFILNIDDIERIHYNSPVELDIYFILKNGNEYNFLANLDDLDKFNELFEKIPLTSKDYFW